MVELVTNVTYFVNRIMQHPIGCVGLTVPAYVKNNMGIIALEKDRHSRPYVDNFCLFRCPGLHLGHDAKTLYAKYTNQPVEIFEGVTIDELHKAEALFEVNIMVYKLNDTSTNLFDGLWARTPAPCTLIYMTHTSHSLEILNRIVIPTCVANVSFRCGNIRPGWKNTN